MVRRSRLRDSGLVQCEDDRVSDPGCERCVVGVRVLEGSDHDGSGRCGYGRDVNGRDEHGRDEDDHRVDCRFRAGDLHGNDLSGHVRHANAHARDAHGRRRSCQ